MSRTMRAPFQLDLHVPNFNWPGVADEELFEQLVEIAKTAEDSGFSSISMMDHYHQIPGVGPQTNYMFEGNTMLAALAARTSTVSLGLLVGGVMYRNPAALAKITTGIDVISGGRAVLGLGAAWFEDEHRAYGFDFPPLKERFERLEDALNIARKMFTEEVATYEGTHHSIRRRAQQPAAAARRHPDPDRRQRREEDAADGRPVRRRLELLRRRRARQAPARRARGPLRATSGATWARSPRRAWARCSSAPPTRRRSPRSTPPIARRRGRRPRCARWRFVGDPGEVAEQVQALARRRPGRRHDHDARRLRPRDRRARRRDARRGDRDAASRVGGDRGGRPRIVLR